VVSVFLGRWALSRANVASRQTRWESSELVPQASPSQSKKIAIDSAIGIAADLCRYLIAEKAFSKIQIFEQRATVGGIWNYVPCPEEAPRDLAVPQVDSHAGVDEPIWQHSNASTVVGKQDRAKAAFLTPMYDRLETNIPRGLMGFSDLPWPKEGQLFPKHGEVLDYIEDFSKDVQQLISFETQVLDVRRDESSNSWKVKTKPVSRDSKDKIAEHIFDAVVVANGHFNIPYIPPVEGMEDWHRAYPGAITHSKFYRKPEHFTGQKVIIVGNSASGIDIGAQIRSQCQKPLIASTKSQSYLQTEPPPDQFDKPPISKYIVEGRTVVFSDGSAEEGVDAVLYCTGYFYSFPFMESLDPPLTTTGERVENLYQHLFYRPYPTLALPVLNQKVIPFPFAEAQGSVIARVFSGRLSLPGEWEMKQWEDKATSESGSGREFHVLKFPKDADYTNRMYNWSMSADGEGNKADDDRGSIGRRPPYWGEKEYWMRERFPAIKKAFQDQGEARQGKRTLEDVGFDFARWKQEKAEEGKRLL
jgi:cation diffusion facilitator CzcD-associated flavoprotein CzcO